MKLIKAIEAFAVMLKPSELGGDVVVTLDPPDFFRICEEHGVPSDADQFFWPIGDGRAVIVKRAEDKL